MKSTGIVRRIDELGRVVIPIELRRNLGIDIKNAVEIFMDGQNIVMKKYQPSCVFCNSLHKVNYYKGKNICENCLGDLRHSK